MNEMPRVGAKTGDIALRLLITASRTWNHWMSVGYIIRHALREAQAADRPLTVVHGDADGGDRIAKFIAIKLNAAGYPVDHEPHPADWSAPCALICLPGHRQYRRGGGDYCPAVGIYRNERMVRSGIDLAAAFLAPCTKRNCRRPGPHYSHGAVQCAVLIRAAGIPLAEVAWERRHEYRIVDSPLTQETR